MKKKLLICFFSLITIVGAFAQAEKKNDTGNPSLSIFPNPATEYITVSNEDAVKNIYVFNALGRKMKTFDVVRGEKYEISDLPNGLYFVQLVGRTNKILTTQRLTKKS
jgi:Secretion system C-terminal sorting domain